MRQSEDNFLLKYVKYRRKFFDSYTSSFYSDLNHNKKNLKN